MLRPESQPALTELLRGLKPNKLLLGIAANGLPVELDLNETSGPVFVIARSESKTRDLLTLAALSCRQSSPDWQITIVTEDPSAWQAINPDFVTSADDLRLANHLDKLVSQKDAHRLLNI